MLKKYRFYVYFLKGQEGHGDGKTVKSPAAKAVWVGVGDGKAFPLGNGGFGKFGGLWFRASTRLEAQGLGGFQGFLRFL